jgi:hypothetical protein
MEPKMYKWLCQLHRIYCLSEVCDYLLMWAHYADSHKTEPERQAIISSVASTTATVSTPAMLDDGKFAFRQEAYVAIASP